MTNIEKLNACAKLQSEANSLITLLPSLQGAQRKQIQRRIQALYDRIGSIMVLG